MLCYLLTGTGGVMMPTGESPVLSGCTTASMLGFSSIGVLPAGWNKKAAYKKL